MSRHSERDAGGPGVGGWGEDQQCCSNTLASSVGPPAEPQPSPAPAGTPPRPRQTPGWRCTARARPSGVAKPRPGAQARIQTEPGGFPPPSQQREGGTIEGGACARRAGGGGGAGGSGGARRAGPGGGAGRCARAPAPAQPGAVRPRVRSRRPVARRPEGRGLPRRSPFPPSPPPPPHLLRPLSLYPRARPPPGPPGQAGARAGFSQAKARGGGEKRDPERPRHHHRHHHDDDGHRPFLGG